MNKFFLGIAGVVIIGSFFWFFQNRQPQAGEKSAEGPLIVATFYPLAHFAEQVVEDKGTVKVLIPTGAEPHNYELSPQDLVLIQKADVFIYNGQQFEPWAQEIAKDLQKKNKIVIEATQHVGELISIEDIGDRHDGEETEIHGEFDPHVWLDPVRAQQIVEAIEKSLSEKYPELSTYYKTHAFAYTQKLQDLQGQFEQGLRSCEVREIITSHDAFEYLAKQFNFVVNPITGISPEAEPSAFVLTNLVEHVKSKKIPVIFFETLVSPKVAETLAKETGARTDVLNPIEGVTNIERQQGENYISLMQKNLHALQQAMLCQ